MPYFLLHFDPLCKIQIFSISDLPHLNIQKKSIISFKMVQGIKDRNFIMFVLDYRFLFGLLVRINVTCNRVKGRKHFFPSQAPEQVST